MKLEGKEGLRKAFRQYFIKNNLGLIDDDKADVMANELWDDATKNKNPKAITKIGKIVRMYESGELD